MTVVSLGTYEVTCYLGEGKSTGPTIQIADPSGVFVSYSYEDQDNDTWSLADADEHLDQQGYERLTEWEVEGPDTWAVVKYIGHDDYYDCD